METMKVEKGGKLYVLLNLTTENALELKTNTQKLLRYFHHCLDTGSNICAVENDGNFLPTTRDAPSTSSSINTPATSTYTNTPSNSANSTNTTSASTGKREFSFICGIFENKKYVYGVKFGKDSWHYFDEPDSMRAQHDSLPPSVDESIRPPDGLKAINVHLNKTQSRNYFENGKFIFKNKELKTYLAIAAMELRNTTSKSRSTKHLVFLSGQTNPSLFLNDFEKCSDVKSDKDKMYQILDFVDECHKGEFTRLYFTSDWASVKLKFLKTYSLSFVQNKKRNLNIDFAEETSLRSFVELKLTSLSKFTTLPFLNQIEMVMNDLPVEISSLFIVHEKMTVNKTEILNFCDSIQDLVEITKERPNEARIQESEQPSGIMEMEVVNLSPDEESMSPKLSRGRGRGRGAGLRGGRITKRGRGRPSKNLKSIMEDNESSDNLDFLQQMDNSSRSSWSDQN